MHDVAPQDVCHCSRRHFANSSRVRAAPFSPRSERTATRQPCGRSGVRPLNYTASLLTCPRRRAPTMKIGMITDSLPEADFDTMLGVAARLEMDMLEFGCGNWSTRAAYRPRRNAGERDRAPRVQGARSADNGIAISALNCSGNPVHPGDEGRRHDEVTRKTIKLASLMERRSRRHDVGLPRRTRRQPRQLGDDRMAARGARDPPLAMGGGADPLLARPRRIRREPRRAASCVSSSTAIRTSTAWQRCKRLRDAVGETVGANFDPSHLMWMGADPLAAPARSATRSITSMPRTRGSSRRSPASTA